MKTNLTSLVIVLAVCFFTNCSKNSTLIKDTRNNAVITTLDYQILSPTALTVSQNQNQTIPKIDLVVNVVYKGAGATGTNYQLLPGGYDNNIESFSMPKGYVATFAENVNGTGEAITYVSATGAVTQNLPARLKNKISYVRYIPIQYTDKKGTAATNINDVNALNSTWYYNWGDSVKYTITQKFVPMTWGKYAATAGMVAYYKGRTDIDHLLSFNEPDNAGQSNIPVDTAIARYKVMLDAGLRMGSPAVTQDQSTGSGHWLTNFMAQAGTQKVRVDFIALHWYDWGNQTITKATDSLTAIDVLSRFKTYVSNVHTAYPSKKIWITEFNANPNRTSSLVHEIFMRNAAAWMNGISYIERYSYFFPANLQPTSGAPNYTLTSIGSVWKNIVSVPAFAANVVPD